MLCITVEQLLFLLEAFDKLFAQIISRGIYDYRKFVAAYAVNIVITENSLDYRTCVRDQHISEFVTVFVVVHLEIVYIHYKNGIIAVCVLAHLVYTLYCVMIGGLVSDIGRSVGVSLFVDFVDILLEHFYGIAVP